MPIYEYHCDSCDETIEALQRLSDEPLAIHDGCGGQLRKLISTPRTRVKENDGMTGSTHFSILRAHENRQIAAEKKNRNQAKVMSLPAAGTSPSEPPGSE